jgi:hypothetical protein
LAKNGKEEKDAIFNDSKEQASKTMIIIIQLNI